LPESLENIIEVLRSRVLRGLEAGTLVAGERLPSARELVSEFGVDHRIVLAAYRVLAEERLVEMRQRGGVYVALRRGADGIPPLPSAWFADVLTEALAREIPAPDLDEWLRRCTQTLRLRAAVVASTSDQVAGLVRELADDFGLEADGMLASELPEAPEVRPPIVLRRADIIVTTEAHADRVNAIGAAWGKPVQVIQVRPDLVLGDWTLLLRQPVYVIVASAKFGDMVRAFFASVKGIENMRMVVLGEDDLSAIPPDAPTYVTQSVRDELRGVRIPGRILPAVRTISTASAREIFRFIVESNIEAINRRAG
jgi:DNA-binding transcriptional regulator YhcF (GntR family)